MCVCGTEICAYMRVSRLIVWCEINRCGLIKGVHFRATIARRLAPERGWQRHRGFCPSWRFLHILDRTLWAGEWQGHIETVAIGTGMAVDPLTTEGAKAIRLFRLHLPLV